MPDYVELHCHTNYSMLDGASHPEELLDRALELHMDRLAATDHEGLYGAVRFYQGALQRGIKPLIGAELTLDGGHHLTLLAENDEGYSHLSRLISHAQLSHNKGEASLSWSALTQYKEGLICLSGCSRGEIASHLLAHREAEALAAARRYLHLFGREHFFLELQHHLLEHGRRLVASLVELAGHLGAGYVATNDVHYARREGHRLHDVLTCIANHTTLDEAGSLLRANSEYYLKSPQEMEQLFSHLPQALTNTRAIAERCDVTLNFSAHRLPPFELPPGETAGSYLRRLCLQGVERKYPSVTERVLHQLDHELEVIGRTGLAEYFLIVWDICRYAHERGIPAQGRGSAANSVVAYVLDITRVDPIAHNLLFERFLSEEANTMPDIDMDFSTDHREEVIQYVYDKYGEEHTAMVCNVVTFRARSAVRDVGKVLGFPLPLLDQVAKALDTRRASRVEEDLERVNGLAEKTTHLPWRQLLELCREIDSFPRHLSIHVGGMIITARPLVEIAPLERATMPGRVVVQFNKDDVEDLGLIKIDLLALRTLSLIYEALQLIEEHSGVGLDLEHIPLDDPVVYDMLCRVDTIGTFQVESRAQAQTLPRMRPEKFEDIVVEVALIRPGPLQGNMVHPYLRRRAGLEEVTYVHPALKPALEETTGVIIFQEQILKVAMIIAGFTPGEADLLRRAISRSRSQEAMEQLRGRFVEGALAQGAGRGDSPGGLRPVGGLRRVRLLQEPRGGLRQDRLRDPLPQGPLSRPLLLRPAERPAHGLLQSRGGGGGRQTPRGEDPPRRREPEPGPVYRGGWPPPVGFLLRGRPGRGQPGGAGGGQGGWALLFLAGLLPAHPVAPVGGGEPDSGGGHGWLGQGQERVDLGAGHPQLRGGGAGPFAASGGDRPAGTDAGGGDQGGVRHPGPPRGRADRSPAPSTAREAVCVEEQGPGEEAERGEGAGSRFGGGAAAAPDSQGLRVHHHGGRGRADEHHRQARRVSAVLQGAAQLLSIDRGGDRTEARGDPQRPGRGGGGDVTEVPHQPSSCSLNQARKSSGAPIRKPDLRATSGLSRKCLRFSVAR